jgi:hypothetical protein
MTKAADFPSHAQYPILKTASLALAASAVVSALCRIGIERKDTSSIR